MLLGSETLARCSLDWDDLAPIFGRGRSLQHGVTLWVRRDANFRQVHKARSRACPAREAAICPVRQATVLGIGQADGGQWVTRKPNKISPFRNNRFEARLRV